MDLRAVLLELDQALRDARIGHALIGGLALAAHGAARQLEQARPGGIEEILHWIDQLRALFGDPPVDRRPWQGDDFRL